MLCRNQFLFLHRGLEIICFTELLKDMRGVNPARWVSHMWTDQQKLLSLTEEDQEEINSVLGWAMNSSFYITASLASPMLQCIDEMTEMRYSGFQVNIRACDVFYYYFVVLLRLRLGHKGSEVNYNRTWITDRPIATFLRPWIIVWTMALETIHLDPPWITHTWRHILQNQPKT